MTKTLLSLLCFMFIACNILQAQEKFSRVSIQISKERIASLQSLGLEIDHGQYLDEEGLYVTTLTQKDIKILKQQNISYKVLIDDEIANFLKENKNEDFYAYDKANASARVSFQAKCGSVTNNFVTPTGFTSGSMGGYYILPEIYQKINDLIVAYPGLIRMDTIGYTFENRPLCVVKLSDNVNSAEAEPQVLYTALHHAREPMSMMNLIFYMQYLLDNYGSNAQVAEIINNRELYFIPCVNPDGYAYNYSTNPAGGGMHRKNRNTLNNTGTNIGVDLNRNYSIDWGADNSGSSPTPSNDTYRGTGPFSELETQAIRTYVNSKNFKFVIDYHAYGNYFINPYGTSSLHPTIPADETTFNNTFNQYLTRYNGYKPGNSVQTVAYQTNGGSTDWYVAGDLNLRSKIYGYVVEIGTSTNGFWPTSSNIIPLAKEQMFHNLQTSLIAGSYGEIQDNSAIDITTTSGNFNYTYKRLGLTNSDVTVTLIPLEGILSVGAPNTISAASLPNLASTVSGGISYVLNPGILAQSRIKYVLKTETDGITQYDTITKFYNPVVLFSDNAESGAITTKWTVSTGWGYATTGAYQGSVCIAESPTGNYSNSSTRNLTLRTAINLSGANEAYISYWVRCNAENMQDKLRILLSTNGVGTNATFGNVLCGSNSVTENKGTIANTASYTGQQNEWRRETISLNNFLGQTNVGIRFQFTSNASTVADGFFIDDIKIVKANAPAPASKALDITTVNASPESAIVYYPNPTNNLLNIGINSTNIKLLEIRDLNGKMIYQNDILHANGLYTIDMSAQTPGMYFIQVVKSDNSIENHKFMKQ